jgi:hypothetical protein
MLTRFRYPPTRVSAADVSSAVVLTMMAISEPASLVADRSRSGLVINIQAPAAAASAQTIPMPAAAVTTTSPRLGDDAVAYGVMRRLASAPAALSMV